MEPTPEQVEAVAEAIYYARYPNQSFGTVARAEALMLARRAIAAMNAEPLTSTPEPSTTETEREAPINQDPPPGFSWEYRAVNVAPDGVEQEWPWGTLEDARSVWRDYADDPEDAWIERRLVGPAERAQE